MSENKKDLTKKFNIDSASKRSPVEQLYKHTFGYFEEDCPPAMKRYNHTTFKSVLKKNREILQSYDNANNSNVDILVRYFHASFQSSSKPVTAKSFKYIDFLGNTLD